MGDCCCGGKKSECNANESVVLNVQGMTCNHCVMSIKNGLCEVKGVNDVEVDLKDGKVTVKFNPGDINVKSIKEAIVDIGYEVV